jgi:hypothetical protein
MIGDELLRSGMSRDLTQRCRIGVVSTDGPLKFRYLDLVKEQIASVAGVYDGVRQFWGYNGRRK